MTHQTMTPSLPSNIEAERPLVDAGHPHFVSHVSGDRRENPVPCALCGRPTLAIRGPLHLTCQEKLPNRG